MNAERHALNAALEYSAKQEEENLNLRRINKMLRTQLNVASARLHRVRQEMNGTQEPVNECAGPMTPDEDQGSPDRELPF